MHLRSYIVGMKLCGVLLLAAGLAMAQIGKAGVDEGFDRPITNLVHSGHPRITHLLSMFGTP